MKKKEKVMNMISVVSRAMDEYDTEISRARETMVLIAIGSLNVNLRDKVDKQAIKQQQKHN